MANDIIVAQRAISIAKHSTDNAGLANNYPDFSTSLMLSTDIETYDPELTTKGPGVFRSIPRDFHNSNGYILGVGLKDEHGRRTYVNLGHYDCTESERAKNIKYLEDTFKNLRPDALLLGQRIIYDLDWLIHWLLLDIKKRDVMDVGIAEALIDENQGEYNLDFMGMKYFKEGKDTTEVEVFCKDNGLKGDVRKWLYKMPSYMVRDYVFQDIGLPLRILAVQLPILEKEELLDLMHLECNLTWTLLRFRKNGVKIDTNKRDSNAALLESRIANYRSQILEPLNFGQKFNDSFNYNSSKQLAFVFDMLEIPYPLTAKGNPSISRDYMLKVAKEQVILPDGQVYRDPVGIKLASDLAEVKRADKVLNTFIDGSFVEYVGDDGLIHCSFYNMRTDEYGTRSGRFSSANPNLQQIPSTGVDEYYGKLARECFVPINEDYMWGKLDYSQIEYRFMAHFARGEGADEVRAKYNADPRTDYHQYIVDLTGLKRRYAKNLNFGVAYGMGAKHMAEFFQWELDYCYSILNIYHSHAPFIKATIRRVEEISKGRGYIKTFLKRRSRLIDPNKAYTMFCRLIQGSAADMMKAGMFAIEEAGLYDVLVPHITVHDEIDVSVPKSKLGIEAVIEMKNVMENCIKIKVPVIADLELGKNWADLTEYKDVEEAKKLV